MKIESKLGDNFIRIELKFMDNFVKMGSKLSLLTLLPKEIC